MAKSYADKLTSDRAAAASRVDITGDDPLAEIEVALDAVELSIALRKLVARKVAQRVADDEMGSGDLVRLLGMLNDRVDGKVADKMEHSGSLTLDAVFENIMGKTAGLPNPDWYAVVDNARHVSAGLPVDSADGLGHNLPVLDGEVLDSDTTDAIISE